MDIVPADEAPLGEARRCPPGAAISTHLFIAAADRSLKLPAASEALIAFCTETAANERRLDDD